MAVDLGRSPRGGGRLDRYDLIVQSLDEGADPGGAVIALVDSLGVDFDLADRALAALPSTIVEDIDQALAERALGPLRDAGLRVRLLRRDPAPRLRASASTIPRVGSSSVSPPAVSSSVIPPVVSSSVVPRRVSSAPPGARDGGHGELALGAFDALPLPELDLPVARPPSRAPSRAPEPEPEPEPQLARIEAPSFFSIAASAFMTPWSTTGLRWMLRGLAIGVVALVLSVLGGVLRFGIMGLVMRVAGPLIGSALLVGFTLAWFRANFIAGSGGDERPDPPTALDLDTLWDYGLSGGLLTLVAFALDAAILAAWVGLSGAPLGPDAMIAPGLSRLLLLANALVALHYPVGLAVMSMRGERLAYFDVRAAAQLALGAPLEIAAVYAAYLLAVGVAVGVPVLVLVAAGPGWTFIGAMCAMAYATMMAFGSLGAMMGAVVRSKPDLAV